MRSLRLLIKMAWRNIWRQKRRTVITLFAMSAGLAFSIPTYGLMTGLKIQMVNGITGMHIGNIQIHQKDYPKERRMNQILPIAEIKKNTENLPGVIGVAPRAYSGGMISFENRIKVELVGLELSKFVSYKIVLGRQLQEKDKCSGIVGRSFAKKLKLHPGSVLILHPLPVKGDCEKLTVVGLYKSSNIKIPQFIMKKSEIVDIFSQENLKQPAKEDENLDSDDDIDGLKKLGDSSKPKIVNKAMVASENSTITGKLKEKSVSSDEEEEDDDDDIDGLKKLDETSQKDTIDAKNSVVENSATLIKKSKPNLKTRGIWTLAKLSSHPVGIVGVSPRDEKKVSNIFKSVIRGKYLSDKYLNNNKKEVRTEIVIGEKLARNLGVKIGDVVGMDMGTINNYALDRLFKIQGIFKTGLSDLDRGLVYINIANAWDKDLMGLTIGEGKNAKPAAHEFAIRLKSGTDNYAVSDEIRKFAGKNAVVRTWQQIEPSMANIVKTQDAMTGILLAIILMIASFGTMNTMLMSVMERIKEFGVLKSIGMKPFNVASLILLEAIFLVITSAIVGGTIGLAIQHKLSMSGINLSSIMPNGFSYQGVIIDPIWKASYSLEGLIIPVVLLCSISILVAVWPAIRAARIKPVEAFRNN